MKVAIIAFDDFTDVDVFLLYPAHDDELVSGVYSSTAVAT